MKNVLLQLAGDGTVWVLAQCQECGDISRHRIADAIRATIPCLKCRHEMEIGEATVLAVQRNVEDGDLPL